jgi:hypothetical protein
MKLKKLSLAIRATTSALIVGVAGQASAFEFQAGDISADVYGFARMNAVYDFDQDIGISAQAGNFTGVDVDDEGATGHFDADAQQSRLGVTAVHTSGVKVNIETDFRGGTFRIRQAYGEYENFLAGRTWSNFNSFVGFTSTLDFDGNAGNAGVQDRTEQVRYTSGALSIALENPTFQRVAGVVGGEFEIDPDTGTAVQAADTFSEDGSNFGQKKSLPALSVRFEQGLTDALTVSVAGIAQQLSVDNGNDDEVLGFAAFGAARFVINETFSVQGAINFSDGANGYLYRSGDEGFGAADAYIDGNGDLETISGYGGTLGFAANVGVGTLNVGYGFAEIDWDDAADDLGDSFINARHETNSNLFVNYQVTPMENVMVGVEYGRFDVEQYDGQDGDANRIMFATQYSF